MANTVSINSKNPLLKRNIIDKIIKSAKKHFDKYGLFFNGDINTRRSSSINKKHSYVKEFTSCNKKKQSETIVIENCS